ncbi:MAG: phospholipid carrier-dependent glycosyltransferase [Cyanobacteria bacterium Co-bin13]|nr:phospholipid carrier-dependent glycosyltransferase [Cyanobacteria bacterium Co-bin13]
MRSPFHLSQFALSALPGVGLVALFLLGLGLRLWGLGRFNTLVFDEVYYVRFAVDYLQQQPFFDAHPPLGKYLIAVGIALVNPLAERFDLAGNTLAGIWLSPWSYRWMTALAGACLPPLSAALAYFLGAGYPQRQRLIFGSLAGGLMLLEGLTLVESRYGLINLFWVGLGLAGQVCVLAAGSAQRPALRYATAGVAFGGAIAVKWNGAGFLLGLYLLWGLGRWWSARPQKGSGQNPVPLALRQLSLPQLLIYWGGVPLLTYCLLWLPHLHLTGTSLITVHRLLWQAHQSIGAATHPYCSAWYTWPLLLRPVAYFYRSVQIGPAESTVYSVQGLGNPVLWWLSTAAVVVLLGQILSQRRYRGQGRGPDPVAVFLLVNYGANWLPWAGVQRCTFLYHYLGSLVFSGVAIAYLLTGWLTHPRPDFRRLAWGLLLLIGAAFVFWLPVYLGLPLSPEALRWRWWLRLWI